MNREEFLTPGDLIILAWVIWASDQIERNTDAGDLIIDIIGVLFGCLVFVTLKTFGVC